MKKSFKMKSLVFIAVSLAASQAFAGTYSVPTTQYPTIQSALSAASSNSVINVGPGVYNENLNSGTKAMITIKSTSGAASTIINGLNVGPIITIATGSSSMNGTMPIVLDGFTVENGSSATTGGVATVPPKTGLTINNCIVENNHATSGGAFAVTGGILKVTNSVIANNTALSTGSAIYATSGQTTLTHNTISDNIAADGAAIDQLAAATLGGPNNIIYGNHTTGGTVGYPIFNGTTSFTSSDIEGGILMSSNIDADPLFVNATNGNFQLSAGSPAIDSAVAGVGVSTDVTGLARPQGAASDMGAYEFAPVPINGTCGSANGTTVTAAPTSNLCASGTASSVSGNGPFSWTCAGSNGGTVESCSAQLQAPTGDVTPPTSTAIATSGTTGATATITVSFSENVLMTKPLGMVVKIGTFNTVVTASGSTATIKLMSCCVPNLVPGTVYTLTIPAGSFRDAAGNLNALITAPVSFGTVPTPVNGVCGLANGTTVTAAPTTNLCTTGTASAVTGSGPFTWTCAGSNGGTTASCAANIQAPADTTPPAFKSVTVTKGTSVLTDVITVTFTEAVISTNKLIKVGTADTTYTVSGTTVTVKIKSCCATKVKLGSTYTLTIPAGSFKDAAGNTNAAIAVPVKL